MIALNFDRTSRRTKWLEYSLLLTILASCFLGFSHPSLQSVAMHSCFFPIAVAGLLLGAAQASGFALLGFSLAISLALIRQQGFLSGPQLVGLIAWGCTLGATGGVIGFTISSWNLKITSQLARSEQKALTDPLTGIANRLAFDSELERLCRESQENHRPLSMLMIDVDEFKQINDQLGHGAGDAALVQVANVIQSCTRSSDLAARIGGDEFGVLLTSKSEVAYEIANRMRHQLKKVAPHQPRITLSVGVSTLRIHDTTRALAARADCALYRAKQSGRDRVCGEGESSYASGVDAVTRMICNDVSPLLSHPNLMSRVAFIAEAERRRSDTIEFGVPVQLTIIDITSYIVRANERDIRSVLVSIFERILNDLRNNETACHLKWFQIGVLHPHCSSRDAQSVLLSLTCSGTELGLNLASITTYSLEEATTTHDLLESVEFGFQSEGQERRPEKLCIDTQLAPADSAVLSCIS